MQRYIEILLDTRTSFELVPTENEYVFANVGSPKNSMNGYSILRKFAKECCAKRPDLLTPTRFRKHMATTLQGMHLDDDEIEQVATCMGHTKKTHAEFYRLQQGLYKSVKVDEVLMLLNKGKGSEFKEKNLNELDNFGGRRFSRRISGVRR